MDFFKNIDFMRFIYNLKYMAIGMLGVFIIIGVIMAATYLTPYLTGKLGKNKKDQK